MGVLAKKFNMEEFSTQMLSQHQTSYRVTLRSFSVLINWYMTVQDEEKDGESIVVVWNVCSS